MFLAEASLSRALAALASLPEITSPDEQYLEIQNSFLQLVFGF